jgi:hypothetical protein
MVSPSIEGLRQAFLDSESRIRLNSDPKPISRTELIAMSWAGGLLDCLRFNESLNVLVGGRGAGKSTLIEGLRYAFELPLKGDEARRMRAWSRACSGRRYHFSSDTIAAAVPAVLRRISNNTLAQVKMIGSAIGCWPPLQPAS